LAKKIVYKNHCTPQEYITNNARWYLDSDCGMKLTGAADVTVTTTTFTASLAVTDTGSSSLTSSQDFFYAKNTGGNEVLIAVDGANYLQQIIAGESIAMELNTSATVKVKCSPGETSTIEYLVAT
jgi:hypothetical protein